MIRELALASLIVFGAAALTQRLLAAQARPASPQPDSSHQVNEDGSITFRYSNVSAKKVEVRTDAALKPLPMSRDAAGMWSATTAPLTPEIYGYNLVADNVVMLDPLNGQVRHNLGFPSSEVMVPARPPAPWELTDIPHGSLTRHVYTTHVAKDLPANQAAYIVYTPPAYDAKHEGGYPVLYLLHGYTDAEDGWTSVGRAHLLLDSMIDSGKAVPMIVVVPLGYGDYNFLQGGFANWSKPVAIAGNTSLFAQMLQSEMIPAVEREYNVAKGRENRAIAGLSMGGLESLTIGLAHPDQFAYVASFSSAIEHQDFNAMLAGNDPKSLNLRMLWVACGANDELADINRAFVTWARMKEIPVTAIETPGAHTWQVWRSNLLHVLPLLFRRST